MSAQVFENREFAQEVLSLCHFRQFVNLSHLDRFWRACAKEVFFFRAVDRIAVNLCWAPGTLWADKVRRTKQLLLLLDGENGCLVGSAVQGLLNFKAADEGKNGETRNRDLNILVNAATFPAVARLLRSEFGMTWQRASHTERPEYGQHISALYRFSDGSVCQVTVSCTIAHTVLHALLASRATCQMNALCRTHLVSFYPHMTRRRMGVLAWAAVARSIGNFSLFHRPQPFEHRTKLHADTRRFAMSCGWACPRLWRQVAGLKGVGVYAWDAPSEEVPFEHDQTIWRIGKACVNEHCPNRGRLCYI